MDKKESMYKQKYLNLRSKYLASIDMAWRDGFEEGFSQSQIESSQQQQQMQEEQMNQMAQGQEGGEEGMSPEDAAYQAPGQPGIENGSFAPSQEDQEMQANSADAFGNAAGPIGSELGKNIDILASMLSKGNKPKIKDLRGVVEKIESLRKSGSDVFVSSKEEEVLDVISKLEE